ncbi:MAG: hypothetical protein ACJ8J0_23725 [Longimicrobiaceae bacterium]
MSFTLNLNFGGLCLYVPDSESGTLEMFALLPPCMHAPHDPRLVFDVASRTMGKPPTRFPELIDLTNTEIDLTPLMATPPVQSPPTVPNLTTIFSQYHFDVRVPHALLVDSNTGGAVNARFRFNAGTPAIPPCAVGGFWFFPTPDGPSRQLPIRVVWSLEVDAPSFQLGLGPPPVGVKAGVVRGINGSTASTPLELFPDPTSNVLELWVLNSPHGLSITEFPPPNSSDVPDPQEPATHVACFYSLTGTSGLAVPLFDHPVQPPLPPSCFGGSLGDPGTDLFCIGAVAMPRP